MDVVVSQPDATSLQSIVNAGLKAVVLCEDPFLFVDPADGQLKLHPDYQQRWDAVVSTVTPFQNQILALYPVDEPYWMAYRNNLPMSTMYSLLGTISSTIKKSFPNIPVAYVESTLMVDSSLQLPPGYDIYGFDCYTGWDPCGIAGMIPGFVPQSIPTYFGIMKSKVVALNSNDNGKRTIVLLPPSTYNIPDGGVPGLTEAQIRSIASNYLTLAQSEPMVNWVVPFLWSTMREGNGTWVGLHDLSAATQDYFKYFSDQILGRSTQIHVAAATASSSVSGAGPELAIDGNATTAWNAGVGADPNGGVWIQLDLGSNYTLAEIDLTVAQTPSGQTTHEIWGGPDPGSLVKLGVTSQLTSDGQVLKLSDPGNASAYSNIRYVRIVTTASPSSVSWREIAVYGTQ